MLFPLLAACKDDPEPSTDHSAAPTAACRYEGLGEWTRQPALPSARESFVLAEHDGWLYAAGGWIGAGATDEILAAELGPEGLGRWRVAGRLPVPVEHAAGAVVDGELWILGGDDGVAVLSEVWRVRLEAGEVGDVVAGPELPAASDEAAAVVDDEGRIVVVGGSGPSGADTDAVLRLDDDRWRELDPLPVEVSFAAAAWVDGGITAAGGTSGGRATDAVSRWSGGAWVRERTLPESLLGHGLDLVAGTLILTGGLVDWAEATPSVLERRGERWEEARSLPEPRFGHGSLATADGRLLVAGGWGASRDLRDEVWMASGCP